MIVFFYGKDTFRSKKKLNETIEEYQKKNKSGINLRSVDAKTIDFNDLKQEVFAISMFKEKKLIVLINLLNSKIKEEFKENIKKIIDSENVILVYEEGDGFKEDLFKVLKEKAKTEEFSFLQGDKLKKWTKKEIEERNGKIENLALTKLADYVGSDLWRMSNEIDKLLSYGKGEIKEKDVEELILPVFETNIFTTIDAIGNKDKKRALSLIKKHMDNGDSVFYIFSMIASQIKNIIVAKTAEGMDARDLGMHPFVFKKSLSQARNFSLEELKRMYGKLLEIDSSIKTGRLDQLIALDVLMLDL